MFLNKQYADATELTKDFRKKALVMHPDKGGDNDRFRKLLEEYKELKKELGPGKASFTGTMDFSNTRKGTQKGYWYGDKYIYYPTCIEKMRYSVYNEITRLWDTAKDMQWKPYSIVHRYYHFIITTSKEFDTLDFICLNSIFRYKKGWEYHILQRLQEQAKEDLGRELNVLN